MGDLEREMLAIGTVQDGRRISAGTMRTYRNASRITSAKDVLGAIPAPNEAYHLVISGRFSLWDMVPALIDLASEPMASLYIATLGFSKTNIGHLGELLDGGQVAKAKLLCSHYFKGTSKEEYRFATTTLAGKAEFMSARTHAKIVAAKFAGGRTVVIESSANLRSCRNIEQMTVIGDPGVHGFHTSWMDSLFAGATDRAKYFVG